MDFETEGRAVSQGRGSTVFLSFTPSSEPPPLHPAVACRRVNGAGSDGPGERPLLQVEAQVGELVPDGVYFLLSADWWRRFRADPSDPSLSPIDNAALLDPATRPEEWVAVLPAAWSALRERFGGGPPVPRVARLLDGTLALASPPGETGPAKSGFLVWARQLTARSDCGDCSGEDQQCFVCRRRSASRCKSCRAVNYCSAECQRTHWSFHKRWCATALRHQTLPCAAFRRVLGLDRRGRVGLHNLGNTCFLSSGLQCLSHVAPLTCYFLSGAFKADLNCSSRDGTGGRLAGRYEELLQELWLGEAGAVSPSAIKEEIARKDSMYRGLQQQDAHEFIERFLDWLQEDVNRVPTKPYVERPEGDGTNDVHLAAESWAKDQLRNDSIVNALLGGQMRSQVQCDTCERVIVKYGRSIPLFASDFPADLTTSTPCSWRFPNPLRNSLTTALFRFTSSKKRVKLKCWAGGLWNLR